MSQIMHIIAEIKSVGGKKMVAGSNGRDRYSQDKVDFIHELSKLWIDNVKWMRSLIMGIASEMGNLPNVVEQLKQNAGDFASILKPIDTHLAISFENLMLNQFRIGQELLNAFLKGNVDSAEEQHNKWYENADKMASFLAEIAPSWDETTWVEKLYDLLNLTEYEAAQIMAEQFLESIAQYNTIENRALSIADSMANGLIQITQSTADDANSEADAEDVDAETVSKADEEDAEPEAIPTMESSQYDTMFTYPENLENALSLIQNAVAGENEDRLFYSYLSDNSPTEEEKQIITGIKDNEIQHYGWFRQIYQDLTGKQVPKQPEEEFTAPENYCDGLARALMGEQNAVQRYRKILYAMQSRVHINMLTQIITDEIRHAILYSYLFTKAGCGA